MSKKIYRSAQGKTIDMGALLLRNEETRAVGNMGVNARGDQIDRNDKPLESRNSKVNRTYAKQTTNVSESPVVDASKVALADDDPMGPMDEPMTATEQFVDGHGDVQAVVKKDDGFSLT